MGSVASIERYRFGSFELQPDNRRLLKDGATVSLRPRAFDLLVALVDRAGHPYQGRIARSGAAEDGGRGSGAARAGVGTAQSPRRRRDHLGLGTGVPAGLSCLRGFSI